MVGGIAMDIAVPIIDKEQLLDELDKGINDMENGRVTPHEESMKILMQRYNDYVLQNSGN